MEGQLVDGGSVRAPAAAMQAGWQAGRRRPGKRVQLLAFGRPGDLLVPASPLKSNVLAPRGCGSINQFIE